jgi:hypothetical protein
VQKLGELYKFAFSCERSRQAILIHIRDEQKNEVRDVNSTLTIDKPNLNQIYIKKNTITAIEADQSRNSVDLTQIELIKITSEDVRMHEEDSIKYFTLINSLTLSHWITFCDPFLLRKKDKISSVSHVRSQNMKFPQSYETVTVACG